MVNNQLKNIKKEGSLARRKTQFFKKGLNQVLPGRPCHLSTKQVN